MNKYSYPNAPITEAVIELRVTTAVEPGKFSELVAGDEHSRYPKCDPLVLTVGKMHVRGDAVSKMSAEHSQEGVKFASADGKYVWQARRNGMALSRLAPYESWEPFRDEARRLWNLYRESAHPESIERLAVRYINRIDIPLHEVDLKEYLRTGPEISSDLPQKLSAFFMQLRIPTSDKREVLINQTLVPPSAENTTSVVLDIDLAQRNDVAQVDSEIWNTFEELRVQKNAIFEACVTDKTRELFK